MLKLKKVAVTGGLSSGKSSVCHIFKQLGAYVVSADELVHQLLTPESSVGQKVIELIGANCVVEGQIDRSVIATKVFNNPKLLKSLESILHPFVRAEVDRLFTLVESEAQASLFVVEIPLLFESTGSSEYDVTIAVIANEDVSRKRFMKVTGYGPEEYTNRMSHQLPLHEKAKRADYVIKNEGSLHDLQAAVLEIYKTLTP